MRCPYCKKKGVSLSHFPKKHGALLARKSRAARRKGPKASRGRRIPPRIRPKIYWVDAEGNIIGHVKGAIPVDEEGNVMR